MKGSVLNIYFLSFPILIEKRFLKSFYQALTRTSFFESDEVSPVLWKAERADRVTIKMWGNDRSPLEVDCIDAVWLNLKLLYKWKVNKMFSDVLNVFFSFLNNFRKERSEIGSVLISFSTKGRSQTAHMKKCSSSPH